jgi:hypothetical protein
MSLLAVQGGATGTGTVTILAPVTNTNRTLTLPDVTDTVAGIAATQTLTNKTLTSATLTSPTLTTPNINSAQVATVLGTAPLYMARAWVNFDGSNAFSPNPSTSAIRGSGNVSSITDNGTGDYTITFTTAMSDVNYCFACSSTNGVGGNSIPSSYSLATILAASFRMIDARPTGAIDRDTFTAVFFR